MPFVRHLHDEFVDRLNELYEAPQDRWWRALVDKSSVYLTIRNNAINAYAAGAAIARIDWVPNRGISFRVHHKYLVFPETRQDPYVDLLNGRVALGATIVDSADAFVSHLDAVIAAAASLGGSERAAENIVACHARCVLDMEIVFAADKSEIDETKPSRRQRSGRIDLIVQCGDQLAAVEIKLRANPELRARAHATPPVSIQLYDYYSWMASDKRNTAHQYNKVLEYYDRLRGKFFESRRRGANERISLEGVDPVPRLLITHFRKPDVPALGRIANAVVHSCQELGLVGFDLGNIARVGSPKRVNCSHFCGNARRARSTRPRP